MQSFVDGTALSGYFGGSKNGWPYYRIAKPGTAIPKGSLYKIAGAQNVFKGGSAASSYDTSQPQLSSAAGQPPQVSPSPSNDPDYAARDITDLWFGWLNYYTTKVQPGAPLTSQLVQLMGQPNVVPTPITPFAGLSWTLANTHKTSVDDETYANAFATTVYAVMTDFSKDTNLHFDSTTLSPIDQFMGFIMGQNVTDGGVFPNAASPGAVLLTQQLIALMRGEPNTSDPVPGQPTPSLATLEKEWYPDPANPAAKTLAGAKAKYNLAPFVWFVHRDLDLFSYAYSVDDAYGNTQVYGTSQLQVGVAGPGDPSTFLSKPYEKGKSRPVEWCRFILLPKMVSVRFSRKTTNWHHISHSNYDFTSCCQVNARKLQRIIGTNRKPSFLAQLFTCRIPFCGGIGVEWEEIGVSSFFRRK